MGKKGITDYALYMGVCLVLAVAIILMLYYWSDSQIKGEAFQQRVDAINLRFITDFMPASGDTAVRYNAGKLDYGIDTEKGEISVEYGTSRIKERYSRDRSNDVSSKINFGRDREFLVVGGKNA